MTKAELKKLIKSRILPELPDDALKIILRKGVFFPCQSDIHESPVALKWKRRYRPRPKRCFYNSQKFTKENVNLDISYWEGIVFSSGFFFAHAWNTIGDDLIDLTMPGQDTAYLGVKIDWQFLFNSKTETLVVENLNVCRVRT
jgi:hypothetical protein